MVSEQWSRTVTATISTADIFFATTDIVCTCHSCVLTHACPVTCLPDLCVVLTPACLTPGGWCFRGMCGCNLTGWVLPHEGPVHWVQ
jgi:hypothetical protein